MSGQSTASSLYSGIFNLPKSNEANSTNDSAAGPSSQSLAEDSLEAQSPLPSSESSGHKLSLEKPQAWSSALRFTPRKNTSTNKPKRAPIQSQLSTAFSNADVHSDPASTSDEILPLKKEEFDPKTSVPSVQQQDQTVKSTTHPTALLGVQTHALNVEREDYDQFPLPSISQPPALSLPPEEIEKDRAFFRARALKRGDISANAPSDQLEVGEDDAWNEEEDVNGFANTMEGRRARRKKRKRRVSPGHHGGLSASLNMDADYDPRIPNDFIQFRKLLMERRDAERIHRKRLEMQGEERDFGADTDNNDRSEKMEERRAWNRNDRSVKFAPPMAYSKPLKDLQSIQEDLSNVNEDDDEKPYLSPPPFLPPLQNKSPSVVTGEDAYQRRLAMSQSSISEPVTSLAYQSKVDQSEDLASRAAKAAAVAARLMKTAPEQGTDLSANMTSSADERDPSTFAERLMMKQGWKKGEALGADGNKGILDPLLAQRIEQERSKQHNRSSRGEEQSKIRANNNVRGTIINPQEEQKRQEEKQKYGEASEVILLENMVAHDDDIDDELPEEIGEECKKHGKVERVFIWPAFHAKIPFNKSSLASSNSIAKPRIFVKFSGIAAAWKCLKELDGRFFAGNTVRARYYPLQDFNRGNYDRLYD